MADASEDVKPQDEPVSIKIMHADKATTLKVRPPRVPAAPRRAGIQN